MACFSDKFLQKWNFPHTCGALDGMHIARKCPQSSGSQYFNYKGLYSLVLMALVDAEYKFIWAVVQDQHQIHISTITVESRNLLKTIGFPSPDPLPNDYQDVPYFLIGARRVVENASGILANRFQVMLTTMQHHPSTVKVIVKACIVLYNIMRIQ